MADKIDQLKIGTTSYDIDLPPDAEPTIAGLTVDNGNLSQIYVSSHNGLSALTLGTDGISPDNGSNQLDIWVTAGLKFEQSKTDSSGTHKYTWTFPEKGGTIALADDIKNATLTIQKNGTNVQTFTANQSSNVTANITVPIKDSDLTTDRYVRYDTNSQGLTSTQQNNVRTNIGAQQTLTTTVVQDGDLVNVIGFDESGDVVKGSAAIPFATETEVRALFGH